MKNRRLLIAACVIISALIALRPSIANADVHVYDKNNQYIGILLEIYIDAISVFIPSLGARWNIDDQDRCSYVYFESADCSGTPYVEARFPVIADLSNSSIGGIYKPDYKGKRIFAPRSRIDDDCQCDSYGEGPVEYFPAIQVQMPFTTPVALPVSFKIETKSELVPFPIVVAPKNQ